VLLIGDIVVYSELLTPKFEIFSLEPKRTKLRFACWARIHSRSIWILNGILLRKLEVRRYPMSRSISSQANLQKTEFCDIYEFALTATLDTW